MKVPNHVLDVLYKLNLSQEVKPECFGRAFFSILNNSNPSIRDPIFWNFLYRLLPNGLTADHVVELIKAVHSFDDFSTEQSLKVSLPNNNPLIGVVGSGKKGVKTFNISTISALVASSLGVYIAKLGSCATSSLTGSIDFMRSVGANINLPTLEMIKILQKTRFGFFSIEKSIPMFDNIYGGKAFTLNSLSFGLPALVTPVKFDKVFYGISHPAIDISAQVLKKFGIEDALIFSCTHNNTLYIDEIGVYGSTKIIEINKGDIQSQMCFQPRDLNIPNYEPKHVMQKGSKAANINCAIKVLSGYGEAACEDFICINVAFLLCFAGITSDLKEGYHQAQLAIRKGLALEKLEEFIEITGGNQKVLKNYLE